MPLSKKEHLLECLSEECSEVSQRVSKALRFSLDEVQPGQHLSNSQRILAELVDLRAITEMLIDEGVIDDPSDYRHDIDVKKKKVEHYMKYSREMGCLK